MRFLGTLILSLIIHLATYKAIKYWGGQAGLIQQNKRSNNIVEMDVIPLQEHKPVVLETLVPDWMLTDKGKARYNSETTKRVKKEMRAALSGITKNAGKVDSKKSEKKVAGGSQKTKGPGDLAIKSQPKVGGLFSPQIKLSASSSISERVDVPIGEMTALNTDQYLFYSFFARVQTQVYYRWEQRVRESISYVTRRGTLIPRKDTWTTQIEVVLDKDGYFEDYNIEIESGLKEFDEAAVYAFREGAPFLNPPEDLVKDGKLRLKYNLQVNWNPKLIAYPN